MKVAWERGCVCVCVCVHARVKVYIHYVCAKLFAHIRASIRKYCRSLLCVGRVSRTTTLTINS